MRGRVFLQQLYPESDRPVLGTPNIDIVLIHGVNGDAIKTWEYKSKTGDTILWPQQLLPQQFPLARVFSFGYNGDLYHNNSIAGIRDLAKTLLSSINIERQKVDPKRPVIFVAHCLGGMIVKQALHTAHYERDFNGIANATKGIFFFGTPHIASSKDQWHHVAKAYSSLDKPSIWFTRSRLMKALQKDSDELMDMMDKFRHMLMKDGSQRWAIGNWYELNPMPGAKAVIVDPTAAQLDALDDETQRAVDADHVGMVRFESKDNRTFGELCIEVRKLVPGEISAPEVDVEISTTDISGGKIHAKGKIKVTDLEYSPAIPRTPGYVVEEEEEEAEERGRQGYLLEGQKVETSAKEFIGRLRTTKVPVAAGR
ncbi:hypothetical protein QBC38DRAFT_503573 [Podospora fimiseda]|uniref:DUF676 domain-containing protein n=1 Tax=Podospora fimiseda TaxID=252190 RepID=A0AAN6YRT6_9PEZI|nr:hypothetical protein QBC38DRAFT_503573 [Podospora fimiseda]